MGIPELLPGAGREASRGRTAGANNLRRFAARRMCFEPRNSANEPGRASPKEFRGEVGPVAQLVRAGGS